MIMLMPNIGTLTLFIDFHGMSINYLIHNMFNVNVYLNSVFFLLCGFHAHNLQTLCVLIR